MIKAKATPPGEPTKYEEMTAEEKAERAAEEAAWEAMVNSYEYKRRQEYATEIDPYKQEALDLYLLENDPSKLEDLKQIRRNIKKKYPKD